MRWCISSNLEYKYDYFVVLNLEKKKAGRSKPTGTSFMLEHS